MKTFIKPIGSDLDYFVDRTAWLAEIDDKITTSIWAVPAGIIGSRDTWHDGISTIFLRGGVVGQSYVVYNTMVTVGGRTDVRRFRITVSE